MYHIIGCATVGGIHNIKFITRCQPRMAAARTAIQPTVLQDGNLHTTCGGKVQVEAWDIASIQDTDHIFMPTPKTFSALDKRGVTLIFAPPTAVDVWLRAMSKGPH